MDFLDPKAERRSHTRLLIGYCLIALAIGIATRVLLYQAYGYGIDRQGEVTQSGLLFVSSQPSGAAIYLNGQRYKSNTDTRVAVPAGNYMLRVTRDGYRSWERPVWVAGGDVQRFVYPFLFPQALQTGSLADLDTDPTLATQSPDQRWLLLGQAEAPGSFALYDLHDPAQPLRSAIALPADVFRPGDGVQTWTAVEWAADNRHVLLQHTYISDGNTNREFILFDRAAPDTAVNLTDMLKLNQTESVNLFNNRIDDLYIYSAADQTLRRVHVSDGEVRSRLEHILAFKAYGDSQILYVTDQSPTGKTTPGLVSAVLQDGQQTVTLRTLPPAGSGSYTLSAAQYGGDWYVAVAATSDAAAYIYKNPQAQVVSADAYPAPWRRVALAGVSNLSFSANSQLLLAEAGQDFAVYDLENVAQYHYHVDDLIDQPQTHATWMDGNRLMYVSGGQLVAFDYDYRNKQTLVPANPVYSAFFASDFSYLYTVRPVSADAKAALTSTSLTVVK